MTKLSNDAAFTRHIGGEADAISFDEINESSNEALKGDLATIESVVKTRELDEGLTFNADDDLDFVAFNAPTPEGTDTLSADTAKGYGYDGKVEKIARDHSITIEAKLGLTDVYGEAVKKTNKILAQARQYVKAIAMDPFVNAFNSDATSAATGFKNNRYADGKQFVSIAHPIKDTAQTFSNTFEDAVQLAFSGDSLRSLRQVRTEMIDKTGQLLGNDSAQTLLVGSKISIVATEELSTLRHTGANKNDINSNTDLSLTVSTHITDDSYFVVDTTDNAPAAVLITRELPTAQLKDGADDFTDSSTNTDIRVIGFVASVAANPHRIVGSKGDASTLLV